MEPLWNREHPKAEMYAGPQRLGQTWLLQHAILRYTFCCRFL